MKAESSDLLGAIRLRAGRRERDDIVFETRATVEGQLATPPAGINGFGYDPIFLYPPYGRTFGEVSDEEKTAVSHRGQAMRAFRDYLLRA